MRVFHILLFLLCVAVCATLLVSLRAAVWAAPPTPQETTRTTPLSEVEVVQGPYQGLPPKRMAALVERLGVDFQVTPQVEQELRAAGADDALLAAIRAKRKAQETEAARQREQEAQKAKAQEKPAGATKVNPKDGLIYVWIPPGTFTMGCSPGDGECGDNEKPAHQVTLSKGFWLGRTEVTQAAYQRVKGANPSYFKGDRLPVEQVNWDEASSYCSAVGMRLPTEAEWEYAARAGSTASRYGDVDAIAWHDSNSGGKTHEVAQKQANPWGLYDMLGNVWEWTADWYDANYYQHSESRDSTGPSSGATRSLRGGSWYDYPGLSRVSLRLRLQPGLRNVYLGVRCGGE